MRLELILLRSPGESLEPLCDRIRASIAREGEPEARIAVFRRKGLDTDLAVHIYGTEPSADRLGDLALQLASELKAWGLVEHSSWEELD